MTINAIRLLYLKSPPTPTYTIPLMLLWKKKLVDCFGGRWRVRD